MELRFGEEVSRSLGNYVYRLIDPRNGETFYVGKGKANRVFDHANASIREDLLTDDFDPKLDRIREILNARLKVIHVIHRHEIADEAVFEVEAALIDAYPGLSNAIGGHGSGARGVMSCEEIVQKYGLPKLDGPIEEKLLLININNFDNVFDRQAIYRQVRCAWRIDANRAKNADYILAVRRGVVIGAYVVEKWLPATKENFPHLSTDSETLVNRHGFIGKEADVDVWKKFVGERGKRIISEQMKHGQNPIRYYNV